MKAERDGIVMPSFEPTLTVTFIPQMRQMRPDDVGSVAPKFHTSAAEETGRDSTRVRVRKVGSFGSIALLSQVGVLEDFMLLGRCLCFV